MVFINKEVFSKIFHTVFAHFSDKISKLKGIYFPIAIGVTTNE